MLTGNMAPNASMMNVTGARTSMVVSTSLHSALWYVPPVASHTTKLSVKSMNWIKTSPIAETRQNIVTVQAAYFRIFGEVIARPS